MAPQPIVSARSVRRNGAGGRRSGSRGQPTQGCARVAQMTDMERRAIAIYDGTMALVPGKIDFDFDQILRVSFDRDLTLDPGARGDEEGSLSPLAGSCGFGDGLCAQLRPEEQTDFSSPVCSSEVEAVKDDGERKEVRCNAVARSNVGLAVSENLDNESRAAAAASAFLRRLAKVGPETTPEEASYLWAALNGEVPSSGGEAPLHPWRNRSHAEAVAPGDIIRLDSRKCGKKCGFASDEDSEHEVVPYAEVYGRHPREFVFGREGKMLPAGDRWGFTGLRKQDEPETSEDDSSDEEASSDDASAFVAPEEAAAQPEDADAVC